MSTFYIPESAISSLEKKLATIQRKCAKYGCEFSYSRKGEVFADREVRDGDIITTRTIKLIEIEAYGTALAESGWALVAKIEHLPQGNLIYSFTEDMVPDFYRAATPKCEHCNSSRHRKETYILRHMQNNAWRQVGSTCLKDFTGEISAELAASIAEWYMLINQFENEAICAERSVTYYETKRVLCYAIECVKHWGYAKTDEGLKSTRNRVLDLIHSSNANDGPQKVGGITFDPMSAANTATCDALVSRIAALDATDDYTHNLQVLLDSEYIPSDKFGYVVSAIPYYNRMVEQDRKAQQQAEQAQSDRSSVFVGQVGDRITLEIASFRLVGIYDSMYGCTYRYEIHDAAGNIFMWDASTMLWDSVCTFTSSEGTQMVHGLPLELVGTVKKHLEFRNVQQTWFTRCRVTKRTPDIPWRVARHLDDRYTCVDNPEAVYARLSSAHLLEESADSDDGAIAAALDQLYAEWES